MLVELRKPTQDEIEDEDGMIDESDGRQNLLLIQGKDKCEFWRNDECN